MLDGTSYDYEDDATHIDAQDIDIDPYISDDEIPDYKLYTKNYSSAPMKKRFNCWRNKHHQHLENQLQTSS